MMKKEFKIQGMKCDHCRTSVEKALCGVKGVTAATVSLATGRAVVEGDFGDEDIADAVEEAGFAVGEA